MRAVSLFGLILAIGVVGCKPKDGANPGHTGLTKLETIDTKVGTGPGAKNGDTLILHFRGTLINGGTLFDQNTEGQEPMSVVLGTAAVIKGWDEGLLGIKAGGKRTLKVPTAYAYGPNSPSEKIPPYSDLKFDIECLRVMDKDSMNTVTGKILKKGTGRPIKDGDTVTISFDVKTLGGTELMSSKDSKPVTFTLGKYQTQARGLEPGMLGDGPGGGMKVGEVRELLLPPGMGIPPPPPMMQKMQGPTFQVFTVTLDSIK